MNKVRRRIVQNRINWSNARWHSRRKSLLQKRLRQRKGI
jgi:hypothetical protein